MSLKYRAILAIVIGCALGAGLPLSARFMSYQSTTESAPLLREGELLAEVMARVKNDYVDSVSDEELLQGAIRGMVQALDPHSEFLDAEEYADIRISSTGNYTGIGVEVSLDQGGIRIVAPFDDTPAQRAGILPGDFIISIDGDDVDQSHLSEAVTRLRGKANTYVNLAIVRDGVDQPINFTLQRSDVRVTSVRAELLDNGIGYVRVSQFNESTANDLKRTLKQLRRRHEDQLGGLVLDLRNNPGGVLEAAVQVSDLFLADGVIVSARGRNARDKFVHTARRGDVLDGAPLVILINGGSASASEIVAGALSDHNRATLVGTTSYGKGSVQTVMPLAGGNAIKLTTSRYFTPSGLSIHETGIEPDYLVTADDSLQTAIHLMPATGRADDPQLARALQLMTAPYIQHSKAP